MAKADAVEVEFSGGERSATRYANSTITANLTEHDQEVTITVRYGQKSASTTVHQFDDDVAEAGDHRSADAGQAASGQPGTDAARQAAAGLRRRRSGAPAAVNFGPAERARDGQAEHRRLREAGRASASGYIPKLHWTDARANSEGLFAYYRYAEASMILTCRTPDGDRLGLGRHDRHEGRHRRSTPPRISETAAAQSAGVAQGARDRAGHLHGDPRAASRPRASCRCCSVAQRARRPKRAEFMSGAERGTTQLGEKVFGDNVTIRSDIGNAVLRQTPVGAGRPRRQPIDVGREGRGQEPGVRPFLGEQTGKDADRRDTADEPGDGGPARTPDRRSR